MASNYFHKQVQGVDVYQIGTNQARLLFNWRGCASEFKFMDYSTTFASSAACQSMAKGRWLVVSCNMVFGGGSFGHRVYINWDGKTLRDALDWAKWYQEQRTVYEADDIVSRTHVVEYEIWHLVDDGDLWQEWDAMSECAGITGEDVTCLQDVWQLQDGYIPTWMDPIIENVKGQSIRDYGYEPVKCSICGDDEFGPWVRLDVPFLGMRYFCECCEGEAKRHGARYVAA